MSDIDGTTERTRQTGTHPAGEDSTDEAFARTVDRQTSSDRTAQALFEREREGATTDTEAAKSLAGESLADERERLD